MCPKHGYCRSDLLIAIFDDPNHRGQETPPTKLLSLKRQSEQVTTTGAGGGAGCLERLDDVAARGPAVHLIRTIDQTL